MVKSALELFIKGKNFMDYEHMRVEKKQSYKNLYMNR